MKRAESKHCGHTIEAWREDSLGGDELLYYSVFRDFDQWELDSGFTTGSETPAEYVEHLKAVVDDAIANPEEYDDPAIEGTWERS